MFVAIADPDLAPAADPQPGLGEVENYAFKDAGAEIVLASPNGGQPPLDPKSNEPAFQTDHTRRFEADAAANAQLATTVRLDSVSQADFDTVFYPGGHGPLWDLAEDKSSIQLIQSFLAADKPVALVCHAPGVLRHVKTPDGRPVVEGKKVTGFGRGRTQGQGRDLFQDRGLGVLRRRRRPSDHGPEPRVVGCGSAPTPRTACCRPGVLTANEALAGATGRSSNRRPGRADERGRARTSKRHVT